MNILRMSSTAYSWTSQPVSVEFAVFGLYVSWEARAEGHRMRLLRVSLLICVAIGVALATTAATGVAAVWPTRPVKIVVAYPAGGTVDVVARAPAQKLGESLGQSFYVENRPGGGGNTGTDYVAKSTPDGYTLLMAADFQFTINPAFDGNLPFQVKDFAPISLAADVDLVLSAHPSLAADNLRELVALAKKQPGTISYGSCGAGSTNELVIEQLQQLRNFKLTEVPYRGSGQALLDLISGRIQLASLGVPATLPYLRGGQLKALAVGAAKRMDALPDVPTISEQGFPSVEASFYACLYAPAGTSRAIIERLHQETVRALDTPDLRERFSAIGVTRVGSTPEALAARIEQDANKWAAVIHKMRGRASE
jgi:tripartite-type tricarboxylate transporter receptor subunit TctC